MRKKWLTLTLVLTTSLLILVFTTGFLFSRPAKPTKESAVIKLVPFSKDQERLLKALGVKTINNFEVTVLKPASTSLQYLVTNIFVLHYPSKNATPTISYQTRSYTNLEPSKKDTSSVIRSLLLFENSSSKNSYAMNLIMEDKIGTGKLYIDLLAKPEKGHTFSYSSLLIASKPTSFALKEIVPLAYFFIGESITRPKTYIEGIPSEVFFTNHAKSKPTKINIFKDDKYHLVDDFFDFTGDVYIVCLDYSVSDKSY